MSPSLEVLTQECLEIMAHFLQDGRVVVSISQVHKGRYVPNSTLRFSFTDGKVIEYLKPHSGVMSENRLFAMNDEPYCTALTASTSLTASSVIPAVLSDRSTSAILEYSVKEDATLPEEKKKLLSDETVVVTCPNRFLRSRTMPELTNVVPAFAYSARSEFAHISYGAATDSRFLKKEELPRFVPPRRSPRNERLFFVGPPVASSPVTACVYSGTFRAGRREGKGMEFSANHSTVYQGDWLEDPLPRRGHAVVQRRAAAGVRVRARCGGGQRSAVQPRGCGGVRGRVRAGREEREWDGVRGGRRDLCGASSGRGCGTGRARWCATTSVCTTGTGGTG